MTWTWMGKKTESMASVLMRSLEEERGEGEAPASLEYSPRNVSGLERTANSRPAFWSAPNRVNCLAHMTTSCPTRVASRSWNTMLSSLR